MTLALMSLLSMKMSSTSFSSYSVYSCRAPDIATLGTIFLRFLFTHAVLGRNLNPLLNQQQQADALRVRPQFQMWRLWYSVALRIVSRWRPRLIITRWWTSSRLKSTIKFLWRHACHFPPLQKGSKFQPLQATNPLITRPLSGSPHFARQWVAYSFF